MPQKVGYRIKVQMISGRIYETSPLSTMAPDGVRVPDLFDALVEHVVSDYATEKAAGRLFDIRTVRETPGITLLHPDQVESIEVQIVGIAPLDPTKADEVLDEMNYDARLAQRFPDSDTQLPPTDVPVEGSASQMGHEPNGADRVILDDVPPAVQPAQAQTPRLDGLNSGSKPVPRVQDDQNPISTV